MTLRRWIAWKLAQLSWRADPTAHYEQRIDLIDIQGRIHQTLYVDADYFGAGVSSSTGGSLPQHEPYVPAYMRVTDCDDGTVW